MMLRIFISVWMAVSIVMFIYAIGLFIRSNRVYKYRSALIDDVFDSLKADRAKDLNGYWRLDILDSVKWDDMMASWTKKLDTYYPEGFAEPSATREQYLDYLKEINDR